MDKEELIIKLIEFDFEFKSMMKDSKNDRFLCKDSYNKHYGRLMIIASEKRTIMKKLEKLNVMKTFVKDFDKIKNKIISEKKNSKRIKKLSKKLSKVC